VRIFKVGDSKQDFCRKCVWTVLYIKVNCTLSLTQFEISFVPIDSLLDNGRYGSGFVNFRQGMKSVGIFEVDAEIMLWI
jgi:hypothetical protein